MISACWTAAVGELLAGCVEVGTPGTEALGAAGLGLDDTGLVEDTGEVTNDGEGRLGTVDIKADGAIGVPLFEPTGDKELGASEVGAETVGEIAGGRVAGDGETSGVGPAETAPAGATTFGAAEVGGSELGAVTVGDVATGGTFGVPVLEVVGDTVFDGLAIEGVVVTGSDVGEDAIGPNDSGD